MRALLIRYKDRLDHERQRLKESLVKCVHTNSTISTVLQSCAACEYELAGVDLPSSWGDRFPVDPPIFGEALRSPAPKRTSLSSSLSSAPGPVNSGQFGGMQNDADNAKAMIARAHFEAYSLGASLSDGKSVVEIA